MGVVAVGPEGPDPVRAVLTFTSEPLTEDVELLGSAKVLLASRAAVPTPTSS